MNIKYAVYLIAISTILSSCSTDVTEETQSSPKGLEHTTAFSLTPQSSPQSIDEPQSSEESEDSEIVINTKPGNFWEYKSYIKKAYPNDPRDDESYSITQVNEAGEMVAQLLIDLSRLGYVSVNALSETGLTAEEIIKGAGDEDTLLALNEAVPHGYLDTNEASIEDQLVASAYLLKISSLFNERECEEGCDYSIQDIARMPPVFTYVQGSATVDEEKIYLPGNGNAILPSKVDPAFLPATMYSVMTPFTIIEIQGKRYEEREFYIDTKELAKFVRKTNGVIEYEEFREIFEGVPQTEGEK